jgi:hypothetical protein
MLVPEAIDALNTAEIFAEGLATQTERAAARERAFHVGWAGEQFRHRRSPAKACVTAALARQAHAAANRASQLSHNIGVLSKADWGNSAVEMTPLGPKIVDWSSGKQEESLLQAQMIRDIFGNPFASIILDPLVVSSAVVGLAQVIYDQRAVDQMPALAELLTKSGCVDFEVVQHCRAPGPHARGCWVLDLILRKEGCSISWSPLHPAKRHDQRVIIGRSLSMNGDL